MNNGYVCVLAVLAVACLTLIFVFAGFPLLVSFIIAFLMFGIPIIIALHDDGKSNNEDNDNSEQEEQKRLCAEREENERRARLEAEARQKQRLKEEEERKAYHKEVQEYLQQKREKEREDRLDAIADAALEYAQTKEWLKEQLKSHTKEEIAGVPKSVKILDGLPYDDGYQGKYGVFSVYTTQGGRCYHAVKGCCGASIDTNLIQAIEYGKTPCSKCARGFPTKLPEWYVKYRKIEKYNL